MRIKKIGIKMFTGLVEEKGSVQTLLKQTNGARIEIEAKEILSDAKIGDSIAVNGCCLTIVEKKEHWFAADAVEETLKRTTLGNLKKGDAVNLERPLKASDRLGGHIVQGHIDGMGTVIGKQDLLNNSWIIQIEAPSTLLKYLVEKGSIAIDGVSLTLIEVSNHAFSFAMIPHTSHATTLGNLKVGSIVNIEVDLIAKYVEKSMESYKK